MADTKISMLTAASALAGTEVVPVVQTGTSKRTTVAEIVGSIVQSMTIALSDETTALTTGTAKVTARATSAMTLVGIPRLSLSTASSAGLPTVDINVGGTSVLHATNKLSVDATEKTSTTATTATSLVTTAISDDAEFTFDVDVAGTGAKGAKVTLYYTVP
jgi:hypothetical protein